MVGFWKVLSSRGPIWRTQWPHSNIFRPSDEVEKKAYHCFRVIGCATAISISPTVAKAPLGSMSVSVWQKAGNILMEWLTRPILLIWTRCYLATGALPPPPHLFSFSIQVSQHTIGRPVCLLHLDLVLLDIMQNQIIVETYFNFDISFPLILLSVYAHSRLKYRLY